MKYILFIILLIPFLLDAQIIQGRQPGTGYSDRNVYNKLQTRLLIADTAAAHDAQLRSDISDTAAAHDAQLHSDINDTAISLREYTDDAISNFELVPERLLLRWRAQFGITEYDTGVGNKTTKYWTDAYKGITFQQETESVRPLFDRDSLCLLFDGVDDSMAVSEIQSSIANTGRENFTIGVLFGTSHTDITTGQFILSKRLTSVSNGNTGYQIQQKSKQIRATFLPGNGTSQASSPYVDYGTWHVLIAQFDRQGYLTAYLDDVLDSARVDISTWSDSSISNPGVFVIGNKDDAVPFKGALRDVTYWNKLLTRSERQAYIADLIDTYDYFRNNRIIFELEHCDGIDTLDYENDGDMDFVVSMEDEGKTYLLINNNGVYDTTLVSSGFGGIEGNTAGDIDGDGVEELFTVDQEGAALYLHTKIDGVYNNAIEIASIKHQMQDCRLFDIDSDDTLEVFYTYEGYGTDSGGVSMLKYSGDDLTNTDNWTNYNICIQPGAWFLTHGQPKDFSGDGTANDWLFAARDSSAHNPLSNDTSGIYWIECPEENPTGTWTKHTIARMGEKDWLHCDTGDYDGDGDDRDVCAMFLKSADTVAYWFDYSASWNATALEKVNYDAGGGYNIWNVPTSSGRDIIMLQKAKVVWAYKYDADSLAYIHHYFKRNHSNHMDDRVIWYDIDNDGVDEIIYVDSGTNRVGYFDREEWEEW